jgi:hypothetical protein
LARVIEKTIDIEASAQQVWAVLSDLGRFHEWNPFMTAAVGEFTVGARPQITMTLPQSRPMTFSPTVLEVAANNKVRWLGKVGVRGLFDGEHTLSIEPRPGGGVRFVNHERFSGLFVPFMGGTVNKAEKAFDEMNRALKARAEERAGSR